MQPQSIVRYRLPSGDESKVRYILQNGEQIMLITNKQLKHNKIKQTQPTTYQSIIRQIRATSSKVGIVPRVDHGYADMDGQLSPKSRISEEVSLDANNGRKSPKDDELN